MIGLARKGGKTLMQLQMMEGMCELLDESDPMVVMHPNRSSAERFALFVNNSSRLLTAEAEEREAKGLDVPMAMELETGETLLIDPPARPPAWVVVVRRKR